MSKNAGELYEQEIVRLLKNNKITVEKDARSVFDKHSNDVTIYLGQRQLRAIAAIPDSYTNKKIIIEVKASQTARMGSGSLSVKVKNNDVVIDNYNNAVDEYVFKDLNAAFQEASTNTLRRNIREFLKKTNEFMGIKNPVYASLPVSMPIDVWEKLIAGRYVASVSHNIGADSNAIRYHYSKKQVDYIQIGGAGLFKLRTGNNPFAGLYEKMSGKKLRDMPLFTPTARAELRAGRSGTSSKKMVTVNYRVEYRLTSSLQSPYSLDNEDDIKLLFGLKK